MKETKLINEFCVNPADGNNHSSSLFYIYTHTHIIQATLMLKRVLDVFFRFLHEPKQGTHSKLMNPLTPSGFENTQTSLIASGHKKQTLSSPLKTAIPNLTVCVSPLPLKYLNTSSTSLQGSIRPVWETLLRFITIVL